MVDKKRKKVIEEYWLKQLAGAWPLLELHAFDLKPGDASPETMKWENLHVEFPENVYLNLEKMSRGSDLALFILFFSAFNVMVYRVTHTDDLVLGSLIPRDQGLINPEPLLLRNHLDGETTLKNTIAQVKAIVLEAYNHISEEYSLEDILSQLQKRRGEKDSPQLGMALFYDRLHGEWGNLNHFNLVFRLSRTHQGMSLTAFFKPNQVDGVTLPGFCDRLVYFLEGLPASLDLEINQIDILRHEEKQHLVDSFNRTEWIYPREPFFPGLLEKHAAQFPDRIAMVESLSHRHLTYKGLVESSRLALQRLRENGGVGPGQIVAIMANRDLETMIGIFSILAAGAAYLPIEPDYPRERINYIMADSGAIMGINTDGEKTNEYNQHNPNFPWWNICEWLNEPCLTSGEHNNETPVTGNQVAYVIYTSGSTGKPKGVLVNQASVLNIIHCLNHLYPFGPRDVYLLKTPCVFDVSVSELFGWIPGAGRLLLLENEAHKDPQRILDCVENGQVSHINFVPSMFSIWLQVLHQENIHQIASLKYIFVAGEALLPHLVEKFNSLDMVHTCLENLYGPTEGTVYSSRYSLSDWHGGPVPIGKPLHNIRLFIFNPGGMLQPIGVAGELFIGGYGVAEGYLNRPELTAERFVFFDSENIRLYRHPGQGEILYKTGDLVRWLPDGNIEYFGRMDFQIKIRGFRIELGEIENQLTAHPGINRAVVVLKEDNKGDRFLCAYLVWTEPGIAAEEVDLREWLARTLPGYMIPAFFVSLPDLPMTPSGKIDRQTLPDPNTTMKGVEYVPPQTELEKSVVAIWAEVLGLEESTIGIHTNFFQLGGHSLKGIALITKIHKAFQVKLTLAILFENPTVSLLALLVKNSLKTIYQSIEPCEEKEYYPLSFNQKQMYILNEMDKTSTAYNIPNYFELEGEPHIEQLEKIFRRLILRHGSLRTAFLVVNREPVQRVLADFDFHVEDLKKRGEGEPGEIVKTFVRPFDLSMAPLLRVGVLKLSEKSYLLVTDMHHAIADGVSHNILVQDFIAFSNGNELDELRLEYKDFAVWDFAVWQNREVETGQILEQEKFWLNVLTGELPVLELPLDFPRPKVQRFEGDSVMFSLDRETVKKLIDIKNQEGCTLFIVILAIFNVFLGLVSNQDDIMVGTPVAGRRHADLQEIIGMFVNTLVLRNRIPHEQTFIQFVREVKVKTLDAFDHQDYPFEKLVNRVLKRRDTSRNPLFDVIFTFAADSEDELPSIDEDNESAGPSETVIQKQFNQAKFDLGFGGSSFGSRIILGFSYSKLLFKRETIERFTRYFKEITAMVVQDPGILIDDMHLSTGLGIASAGLIEEEDSDFEF